MLISPSKKFVIITTPKCASSSLNEMLSPYCEIKILGENFKHTTWKDYHEFLKPFIKKYFAGGELETIAIIREPISHLNSWYRYRSREALRDSKHKNHTKCTYGLSFSNFLEAFMSENSPPYAQIRSQSAFLTDTSGVNAIDRLFDYGDLKRFVSYMEKKIGTRLSLPAINVSPQGGNKGNYLELSTDLSTRIKKFLSLDYMIYDSVCKNKLE